jgi:hypothetical protein
MGLKDTVGGILKNQILLWVILLILLIVFGVLFYIGVGVPLVNFFKENPAYMVALLALIVFTIAVWLYITAKQRSQDARKPFFYCLEASFTNPNNGALVHNEKSFQDIDKGPSAIMCSWIEPFFAWLAKGDVLGNGKKYSFLISGDGKGDVLLSFDWMLDWKYEKELMKKGISLEEAYAKIMELRQTERALKDTEEV